MRDSPRDTSGDKPAPKAVVGRVCLYLRQLEALQRQGETTISSNRLGSALALNDAQVRKDLAFFGQFGHPGIGYRVDELIDALRHALGIDRDWPLALIGMGNLGRALLRYRGFRNRGFHVVALFDNDSSKVGQVIDGMPVRSTKELAEAVREQSIQLAVLSVPAEAAQAVADLAVAAGIHGILNFAPVTLNLPPCVGDVSVDLTVQLEHLAYKVRTSQDDAIQAR